MTDPVQATDASSPADAPAAGQAISQAGEQRSARVESLRALAALSVVACHVFLISHLDTPIHGAPSLAQRAFLRGGYGVFLFFCLTGYLLFWPFAKQHFGSGDQIDVRRYATNRILRIMPLYFAVVVILLVLQESGGTSSQWLHFATLTENYSTNTVATVDPPIWSVVVEIQFYALLPFLAWGIAALAGRSRARAAGILLALGLASLALRYHEYIQPNLIDQIWRFSFPVSFMFFVPGLLLALLRLSWEERRPTWLDGTVARADAWLWAAAAIGVVIVVVDGKVDPLVTPMAFLIVGACVLPLRAGPLTNALQWRPLALLGIASYSLYMWHYPILSALQRTPSVPNGFAGLAIVGVPLVIGAAAVSYLGIESPFLRLRRQWARSAARQERAGPG